MIISAQSSGKSLYEQFGSVFTEFRAMPGPTDQSSHDQSIDVGIIEFDDDDDGSFIKADQLDRTVECITKARQDNPNGVVVVVFIHGWHHDALWHDTHFIGFRTVLMGLALREAEREKPRRVIGVYFGWPGENRGHWLYCLTSNATFFNRYKTAERIGNGEPIKKAIRAIIRSTKKVPLDDASGATHDSPLIMVSHSMGALMLETAFLSLLCEEGNGLIEPYTTGQKRYARVEGDGQPVTFPDLILLLNSAADSQIGTAIKDKLKEKRLKKTVSSGSIAYEMPLLISATSMRDWATKCLFRFGKFGRKTDGNDRALTTHRLKRQPEGALCSPKQSHLMVDFNQAWHCLRHPAFENQKLTSIAIDLPQERDPRNSCHVRYVLSPKKAQNREGSFWLFKVPGDIINSHNDVFNARSNLLMMALIQASGALMSLARDLEDTFETEEGSCALQGSLCRK